MIRENIQNIRLSIRRISEKAGEQDECIRLDIGEPSFDTPEHVKQAAREKLEEKQGYTSTMGIDELRQEIAREESGKKGINVEEENIIVTTGGMGALYSTFSAYLEEDTAVFNDPCWGPYKLISQVVGNSWSQVKFFNQDGLREEARREIRDSNMVVVNTPSNPAGRVLEKEESKEIAEVAEDFDTVLVADDAYHRLTFGKTHYSPAAFSENSIIIGSASKNHAMTGWRVGWAVASPEILGELGKVNRAMNAAPPRISQNAAVEALANDSHVEEMRSTYSKRRDLVVERMDELGWSFVEPQGAIYAFPEVRRDSRDFCFDMVEKGVAMVPGEPFGPESDQNIRISFGSSTREEINRGFDILEREV